MSNIKRYISIKVEGYYKICEDIKKINEIDKNNLGNCRFYAYVINDSECLFDVSPEEASAIIDYILDKKRMIKEEKLKEINKLLDDYENVKE